MIFRRPWHPVSLTLLGLSLALHLFTLVLYVRLPSHFAAFTVFPIWTWGLVGLLLAAISFVFFRGRLSLLVSLVWCFTILIFADESSSLGRLGQPELQTGKAEPHARGRVLRVLTLNCARRTDPYDIVAPYKPDIIFLQEIPHTYRLKKLIDDIYDGQGDYRYDAHKSCAVVVNGKIEFEVPVLKYRSQLLTAKLASGEAVQLMNVHLQGAATNLRLWERKAWQEHRVNRELRQIELAATMGLLRQKTAYPRIPALVAGDFNAPANDAVYKLLGNDFTDAFEAVGTGWGNTYHRSLPLLRIDHIFSSSKLIPVRSKAVRLDGSDHRMVIADYIFR
ncbi:endonuclease/exonuclease/phosphatase family protein [Akkermansiaceae bacterium]|nr:endonuclease/exonuclease/phosphatase family protein [Akkermansiaceae bacterium]MDB4452196.1 endonuclease/exonuclease/phosphatase family protein [Akkermansiaceae bacterium]